MTSVLQSMVQCCAVPWPAAWAASVSRHIILPAINIETSSHFASSALSSLLSALYKGQSYLWRMWLFSQIQVWEFNVRMISDALVAGFVLCFFTRTSIGSKQKSMCLSRPLIIPSWSACTPVFRQKAGEALYYPGLLPHSLFFQSLFCLFNSKCVSVFQTFLCNWICKWRRSHVPHAKTTKTSWRTRQVETSSEIVLVLRHYSAFHACVFKLSSVFV